MTLRIGSLFSGYGGLTLATEQVFGGETVWTSDIDPGACKVLAHRFPHARNLGDITAIDWADVPPIDILDGGSPCQDLSTAGRRAGMTDGTRSNLWITMREAIAHLRPRYVIWENVRGAYSATATSAMESDPRLLGDHPAGVPALRALGRVLGDLADLGYDAQWCGLRAADVGAAHGRFRVFLLATDTDRTGSQGQPDQARTSPARRHGHPQPRTGGPDLTLIERTARCSDGFEVVSDAPSSTSTYAPSGALAAATADAGSLVRLLPTPTSNIGDNGGPQDPAKRRAGGHSVSIEDAVHGLTLLPTPSVADTQGGRKSRSGDRSDELLLNGIAHADRWGEYAAAIARWEAVMGPAPSPTETGPKGNPRLSAEFTSWLMGLPAGWITDVPDVTRNQALKLCGNGVVPAQAIAALTHMITRTERAAVAAELDYGPVTRADIFNGRWERSEPKPTQGELA